MTYWHTKSLYDHKYLEALHAAEGSAAKTLADRAGFDGRWSTSMERLAKDAGVSKPTVIKAMKELERLGLISRHREGRRSATVYTWHSCPPGCSDPAHTGKKDSRVSKFLYGAVTSEAVVTVQAEAKPVSKRRKRAEAKKRVKESLQGVSEWSSHTASGKASGKATYPLKDENRLKSEAEIISASGKAYVDDPMWHYGALYLEVQALADSDYVDALTAEVLLDMLDDPQVSSTVAALAVEMWGDIPSPLTFEQVEALRETFETSTGFDTRSHYMAIYRYGTQGAGVQPWRHLPQATKDKWLRQYAYATAAMQVSEVARSVKETAPAKHFGQLFTPAPVDDLMAKLSALSPE